MKPVMFKSIITSLVIFLGLMQPTVAEEKGKAVSIEIPCVTLENLTGILQEHGEEPMLVGSGSREVGGRFVTVATVLFVNPKTFSWTLVEQIAPDLYCAVAMGQDLTPYTPLNSI